MNVPPAILDLRIAPCDGRPVHVWLPLFLLWPLLLVLGVLALAFTVLADVVLFLVGRRYHYYTLLLLEALWALNETRGMVIRVKDSKAAVDMTVQ